MGMKFVILLLVVEAVIVWGNPANQEEGKIKIKNYTYMYTKKISETRMVLYKP